MQDNLITIGITCYREGDWLRECWGSVLAQTDDRWEAVLIMDGGADEKTIEVFNSIEHPKLRKYAFEENMGPYVAQNKGFELTDTPYHFILDADDMLFPDSVKMVLETFEKHPDAACVYGDVELFNDDGTFKLLKYVPKVDITNVLSDRPIGACAFTLKVWDELGGFSTVPELARGMADFDFHISIAEAGYNEIHCGGVFYRYRKGHDSVYSSYKIDVYQKTDIIMKRHPKMFDTKKKKYKFMAYYYSLSISGHWRAGNAYKCSQLARVIIKLGGFKRKLLWSIALYPYLPEFVKKIIKPAIDTSLS